MVMIQLRLKKSNLSENSNLENSTVENSKKETKRHRKHLLQVLRK